MTNQSGEFVGPEPHPEWQRLHPTAEHDQITWSVEEIGIDFTATPAASDPAKWDVRGKDKAGNRLSYPATELLRDPANPHRLDIVRSLVSRHKKELVIGIASGMAIAMVEGVVAFQKHRATK